MIVKVTFSVDVDPDSWNLNYGTGTDPAAVRADVRTWCENGCYAELRELGLLRTVTP